MTKAIPFSLCALVLVFCLAIPLNKAHITERGHTEALSLFPAYQSGACAGKWVGYNITQGIVMVVCGIPDNPSECLYVSYRVTENAGTTILVGEAYNTTAYVDLCYKAQT